MGAQAQRVAARYLSAAQTIDMIAAVSGDRMLGANDFLARKYHRPEAWKAAKRGLPFGLYRLRKVPIELAERLADVGTPASDFPNGRVAWQAARRYADSKPFATFSR